MSDEQQRRWLTLHLTPVDVWRRQADQPFYEPEAFGRDGFIHCTDGEQHVLRSGDRFCRTDGRPYVVLVIDVERVQPPVRVEDPDRMFPHIYGPLNTGAVVTVRDIARAANGTFLRIVDGLPDDDLAQGADS